MRIHIESLNNTVEDEERVKEKMALDFDQQMTEIKREKRRLDDLLTIRENELSKLKDAGALIEKKEQVIAELEKKIKSMEKKHEKTLAKMHNELQKYKKKIEQHQSMQLVNENV